MPRRALLLALLVAAIVPYFVGLGDSAIWDANEAFYVETPREMIERGDYISPTFNYEPRLNKPVLSYWIVAGFYKLFGVSVAVQRIPIAIGGLVMIAVAFWLACAATPGTGIRDPGSAGAALLAAVGLAINPRLLMFARRIFIDIYISMFMALTLLFFALAERFPARRRLFLILMYVSVGLGALTKGPVAIVLPGLVFAVYLVAHGELRRIRDMMLPLGVVIVAAIVVPWYAALYQRYGWTYIASFVLGENVARYTEGYGVESERGWFFYLPVLFSDSFPWSAFLIPAAFAWWAARHARAVTPDARVRTLLWIWVLSIVGFFSLSAAKQDLYIFPIVPAVAALAAIEIMRSLTSPRARVVRIGVAVLGVILVVIGVGVRMLFTGEPHTIGGAAMMGFVGIVGGMVMLLLAARGSASTGLAATIVTMIAVNWVFVLRVLPAFETFKPVPAFARTIESRLGAADAVVATYDEALPSLVYYLRRHIETLVDEPDGLDLLRTKPAYVVMSEQNYRRLAPLVNAPTCAIDRRPTFDVKLRNVLAQDELPHLVVVTNRCD
jgi:4-amino-4-deoxy-L-arabinose transferase-like glycosyltransferase